jgi:hypothetical protein
MRGLATRKTQSVYAARSLEGGSGGVRSAGAKNLAEHATRPRFVLDGGLTRPGAGSLRDTAGRSQPSFCGARVGSLPMGVLEGRTVLVRGASG